MADDPKSSKTASADTESFDASAVIAAVTESLLGQSPTLTRLEVAKKSGLPPEVNAARWRALGFPEVSDDDVAFTKLDVDALKVTESLINLGFIERDNEEAFIRTVGRTFARLAEQLSSQLVELAQPARPRLFETHHVAPIEHAQRPRPTPAR